MDGSSDRFLDLIHQLEDFTHAVTPDQAHSEFDETALQLFWEELAGPSTPHSDSELFEIGESG
jgi:hypothetical protein